jgi:hypothetical protein
VHEVAHHAFQQHGIALHGPLDKPVAQGHPVLAGQLGVRVEHLGHHRVHPHRHRPWQAPIALRKDEQAFDEPLVALVDEQELTGELLQVRVVLAGHQRRFHERALHGEGSTQLVRRVRREPSLALEPDCHPVEHVVERGTEPPQLVARPARFDALAEVLRPHLLDGVDHRRDRPQHAPGQQPRQPGEQPGCDHDGGGGHQAIAQVKKHVVRASAGGARRTG